MEIRNLLCIKVKVSNKQFNVITDGHIFLMFSRDTEA